MRTLLMGIIAVLVTVFIPFRASAQLPDSLPIGSEQRAFDWIVTNTLTSVIVSIEYTNSINENIVVGRSSTSYYDSYAQLQTVVLDEAVMVLEDVRSRTDVSSSLRYYVSVRSYDGRNIIGLVTDTNIGHLPDVTIHSLSNAVPSRGKVSMWIDGIQTISIQVDSVPPYQYRWSGWPSVTTNIFVVDAKYCTGTNRARFTLTLSNGSTKTYTQFGNSLNAPSVIMLNPTTLKLKSDFGSDVDIESSDDLKNWRHFTSINCMTNDTIVVDIQSTKPCNYFRAIAR